MKLRDIPLDPVARWPYEQAFALNFIIIFERDEEWQAIERTWSKYFNAYFSTEAAALRHRLDYINRKLNP